PTAEQICHCATVPTPAGCILDCPRLTVRFGMRTANPGQAHVLAHGRRPGPIHVRRAFHAAPRSARPRITVCAASDDFAGPMDVIQSLKFDDWTGESRSKLRCSPRPHENGSTTGSPR